MIKQLFYPFGDLGRKARTTVAVGWAVFLLICLELFHGRVIPAPSKVFDSLLDMVVTRGFYEDMMASLLTTFKAMFFSLVAAVSVVYASTIQFFRPLADLISKFRYLTLTGLIFVFTMVSHDVAELKMYLLMFGITPFFVTSFMSVVNETPPEEKWKGYVNKMGRWGTLYEVIIVGKLDMLFEVMRQNFAISWMMITTVEGLAMSEGGIGTLLIKSNKYLNLGPVFAMLFVVLLLGLTFDYFLSWMRNILFPYLKKAK